MHDPRPYLWLDAEETNLLAPEDLPSRDPGWGYAESELTHLLRPTERRPPFTRGPAPKRAGEAPAPRHRKRRPPSRRPAPQTGVRYLRWVSLLMAATAAALVAMLSVLGGVVSYGPLRDAAASSPSPVLTSWWPLLVYGPWVVASLSIMRGALHRRRPKHSWTVVVIFSGFAVLLCIAQAPMTVTGVAVAGIPPISALAAFQQVVRHLTLLSPPRHAHPGGPRARL